MLRCVESHLGCSEFADDDYRMEQFRSCLPTRDKSEITCFASQVQYDKHDMADS